MGLPLKIEPCAIYVHLNPFTFWRPDTKLDPAAGDASLYRTRDLVPQHLMPLLARGRVLVTNWHVFEPQEMGKVGDIPSRVIKRGVIVEQDEVIYIGEKNTKARDRRYLTLEEYEKNVSAM